ncbi:DUF2756 domain-containing protein [Enterobacteriaceae bacterium 4M9]|nr:DUF2756 domain-containing protein [Enterobacteriaceae bacterium 4M9]
MKTMLIAIAALLPLSALAQPLTPQQQQQSNDARMVNPSLQRQQQEMQLKQNQQQSMLNQSVQNQQQRQQQNLQNQIKSNNNLIQESQPGKLIPLGEQPLPNTDGGMLNGGGSNGSGGQHMLQEKVNGDMLHSGGGTLTVPSESGQ